MRDTLLLSLEDIVELKHRKFEESIVKSLYDRYGLPAEYWWHLINKTREELGRPMVRLVDFNALYEKFPVMMEAAVIHNPEQAMSLDRLFRKFSSTLAYVQFVDIFDLRQVTDGLAALIIKWPYANAKAIGGAMVLHNVGSDWEVPGPTWLYREPGGEFLYLQPLWRFLDYLDDHFGTDWTTSSKINCADRRMRVAQEDAD